MHPALIKAELQIKGFSQKDIAEECDVTESTVSHVIKGKGSSKHVALCIAGKLGKTPNQIWPERYPEEIAA